MMYSPELSIVVVTRNDNHGGDLSYRMQLFIEGIYSQAEKYQYPVELVLVEWNPPIDCQPLVKTLSWSKNNKYCFVRIITVPNKVHQIYKHATNLPLYQMIGKNVGIRRSKGKFVLATNVDILFSDELFEAFVSGQLQKGKMYRVDRYDVRNEIPVHVSHQERLKYCESNIIRINERFRTTSTINNKSYPIYPQNVDKLNESLFYPAPLHTNACGDFQLMAREQWNEIHGYPELDAFSMHIDSLFEFITYYHGIEEIVLSAPVYHIEHTSGWSPEGQKELFERISSNNIKSLEYEQLFYLALKMEVENISFIFNDQYWGLAKNDFSEYIINEKGVNQIQLGSEKNKFHQSCNTEEWFAKINQIQKEMIEDIHKRNHKNTSFCFEEDIRNKKVVVFGAGGGYDRITKKILDSYNIRQEYIVDNDPEKVGTKKDNIQIYSVEKLLDENKEEIMIIVSSQFYQEIKVQLEKMGFLEHKHFFSVY